MLKRLLLATAILAGQAACLTEFPAIGEAPPDGQVVQEQDAGYIDGEGENDPRNVIGESDASLPDMNVPDAAPPEMDVPSDATPPDMNVPDGSPPDMDVPPDATLPDMNVPDGSPPDMDIPEPDMDVPPDAALPDMDVPEPDMDVPPPDMDVPDAAPIVNPYRCDDNGTEDLIVFISATGDEIVTVHYEFEGRERSFSTRPRDPQVRIAPDLCNLPARFWIEGGAFSLSHNYPATFLNPGLSHPDWPDELPSNSGRNGRIRTQNGDPVNIEFPIPDAPL